jgi:hypothetical protein
MPKNAHQMDQKRSAMDLSEDGEAVATVFEEVKQDVTGAPIKSEGSSKTVIVFDWDDTLLASSFLSGKGYRLDSEMEKSAEVDSQLRELEQAVSQVLTLAMKFGHVFVVTNAETGWVQLSAQKFMPGLVPLLSKIKVISARSTYEKQHPDSPLKWKFCAFQESLTAIYGFESKCHKNVISFGDSHVEREAVRAVTRGLPNAKTKSVKFAERPSMEQLRRQIELVTNCFSYIFSHDGDLDLQLTISVQAGDSPVSPTADESSGAVEKQQQQATAIGTEA